MGHGGTAAPRSRGIPGTGAWAAPYPPLPSALPSPARTPPPVDSLGEQRLIRAAREGDRAAFTRLVERYGGQVAAAMRSRLGSEDAAMDVVQETWVRVARGLSTFRDGAPFRPWLFAVAFNALRDDGRRAARAPLPIDDDDHAAPGAEDPGEARLVESEAIDLALARVPEPFRSAVHTVDVLGLDHGDAASALGCAGGTLKSRLHRGRRLFCEHYLRLTGDAPAAAGKEIEP